MFDAHGNIIDDDLTNPPTREEQTLNAIRMEQDAAMSLRYRVRELEEAIKAFTMGKVSLAILSQVAVKAA